jgi:hypothetical protein
MRLQLLMAALALASVPAFAQPAQTGSGRSPGPPLDQGPSTPDANAAHRGGGVILEGPPGAPAPPVMQTAPRDLLVAPGNTVIQPGENPRSAGVPVQPR